MSSAHRKIHREILRGARHREQMQDDERLQKPGLHMSLRAMPLSAQPPHRGRVGEQDLAVFARELLQHAALVRTMVNAATVAKKLRIGRSDVTRALKNYDKARAGTAGSKTRRIRRRAGSSRGSYRRTISNVCEDGPAVQRAMNGSKGGRDFWLTAMVPLKVPEKPEAVTAAPA